MRRSFEPCTTSGLLWAVSDIQCLGPFDCRRFGTIRIHEAPAELACGVASRLLIAVCGELSWFYLIFPKVI
jgi:hypothetical protein